MMSYGPVSRSLPHPRVLIAEHECLVSFALESILDEVGCSVAGSAHTVAGALAFSLDFDVAILDVDLMDGLIDPMVEKLNSNGIPWILTSGDPSVEERYPGAVVLNKPYLTQDVWKALARVTP